MNWRRGFFRLWCALSLLWLLGCAIGGYYGGFTAKYLVTDPSGLKYLVTTPHSMNDSDLFPYVKNLDVVQKRQDDCRKERGPWCEYEFPVQMPGLALSWLRFAAFSISIPIVVFLAGALFSWVISGFKKTMVSN